MNTRKWQLLLVLALSLAAVIGMSSCTTSDATSTDTGGTPPTVGGQSPPDLLEVLPTETCGTAGSVVILAGSNLSPSNDPIPGVTINGVPATVLSVSHDAASGLDLISVQTGAQVVAIPPGGLFVDVRVVNDNGSDTLQSGLRLLPSCTGAPVVVTIDPSQGPRTGGTAVSIQGDNLACVTSVQFVGNRGGGTLRADILGAISDQELVVEAPVSASSTSGEQFSIVVTSACGTTTLADAWSYTGTTGGPGAIPNGLSITPASGSAGGGNQVLITGNDLNLVTSINFGGNTIAPGAGGFILTATGDILIPSVPASVAGSGITVSISVTVIGANGSDASPVTYTYLGSGAPACATIAPTSGTQAGGVLVTITGTGLAAVDGVLFGGVAATAIAHPQANVVVATAPAYIAAIDVDVELQVAGVTVSRCAAAFTYIADTSQAFTVTSITPKQGLQSGLDTITISGTGLATVVQVAICGVNAAIVATSQTQVTATTGAYGGTVPFPCDVVVRNAAGLQASLVPPNGFTYLPVVPDATEFSLAGAMTAPEAGGTAFRVTNPAGTLIGVRTVTFSGIAGSSATACNVQVQSNTEVTGISPRYITPGGPYPATVSVVCSSANGADPTPVVLPFPFTYYPNPTLSSAVGPAGTGVVQAGDLIRLSGNTFRPVADSFVASVTIANSGVADPTNAPAGAETLNLPFTVVDNNLVTFSFPAVRFQDFYDITITTPNGGLTCTNTYSFTLIRALFAGTPPPVASVRPNRGRWSGGTTVVVSGSFSSPATSVTINGIVQPIQSQTTTAVVITTVGVTEASAGTPLDVVVSTQGGASLPLPGAYTFIPDPDLASIEATTPNCGLISTLPLPVSQGQTFTIRGTDLIGVNSITVVGSTTTTTAVINSVSDTVIVAQVPAEPTAIAPPYNVTVSVIFDALTTPVAQDAPFTHAFGGAFAYQNAPTIATIAPASGSPGTLVTMTGTGLRNVNGAAVQVSFGAVPSANVSPNSAGTSLTAIAPPGAEGSNVPVNITTCQGAVLAGTFRYPCVTQPRITLVAPTSGSALGGTIVTITGTNLLSADGAPVVVNFGAATGVVDTVLSTATSLIVTAPSGAAGTAVAIRVTTCAGTATATSQFIYGCVSPTVQTVTPAVGAAGSTVVIAGNDLVNPDGSAVTVQFGGVNATVVSSSATSLSVLVPAGAGVVNVTVTTCGGTNIVPLPTFQYCVAPTVTNAAPLSGPADTAVVITGTNLLNPDASFGSVVFGSVTGNVAATNGAGTTATLKAPPGTGSVLVRFTTCGGTVNVGTFLYCAAPTIATVSPSQGPPNTLVTLTGTNFLGADGTQPIVTFAGTPATVTAASATTIIVRAPIGLTGPVALTVSTCGGSATATSLFNFCNVPAVTGVVPNNGPAGTTGVIIQGTNFIGSDGVEGTVRFGTQPAIVSDITATTVTVTVPTGPIGSTVNVRVTTCGGTSAAGAGTTFTYSASTSCVLPTITSVAPGAAAAGSLVTIDGTGLIGNDGNVGIVRFGAAVATVVTSTASRLVVTAPAGAGTLAISVTTCGGSANAAAPFIYCSAPTITLVNPPSGSSNINVTITGTNFVGNDGVDPRVFFGTQEATVLNRTGTSITVEAPGGFPSGTSVNVRVQTCGGTVTGPTYTYTGTTTCTPPVVTSIAPEAGVQNNQVVITGTNLIGADNVPGTVQFGTNPATVITATATQMVVTVPAGAGSVQVRVTTCGGSASGPDPFVYCTPPTITSVTPATGPVGQTVTIAGTNFLGANGAQPQVAFGTAAAAILNVTANQILCLAPAGFATGTALNVRVTTCGGTVTAGTLFTYTGGTVTCTPPTITGMTPAAGVGGPGGTQVTLVGTNLIGADSVTAIIRFAAANATVLTATATQIVVIAPAGAGSVAVSATTCGGATQAPVPFVYCTVPAVPGLPVPATGAAGTSVTLAGSNLLGADGLPSTVRFGTQVATIVSATNTQIIASAPAGIANGTSVPITVSTCGGTATAGGTFLYSGGGTPCVVPVVSGMAPASGLGGPAGTLVTLTGSNLVGADGNPTTVTFGGVAATVITSTGGQVVVRAPAGPVGSVAVRLTTCGGTADAAQPFTYCVLPAFGGPIVPTTGGAGTVVTLTGVNLVGADGAAPIVRFGATAAAIVSASAGSVVVTAPAGIPNGTSVPVTITTCGGTATGVPNFAYTTSTSCLAPVVSGIAPASGIGGAAGTIVTLTGSNLVGADGNPTTVAFGGVAATVITSTGTSLTVRAPAGPVGSVAVRVTTCGGAADAPQPFVYCILPTITANVAPATGSSGTAVTITGTNLVGADGAVPVVRFGTAVAAIVSQSATTIIATAPAGIPNGTSVSVTVTTCGGTATSPNTFLYSGGTSCVPPVVTAMNPSAGVGGVTLVTITGSALVGADLAATVVNFGATAGTVITQTATSLTVRAAAGAGTVAVTVITCGGSVQAPQPFIYCTAPPAPAILPTNGPAGTLVTLTAGGGLQGADGAVPVVTFGSRSATVIDHSATQITVEAPVGFSNGTVVSVKVTTCGGTATALAPFQYQGATSCVAPTVTTIAPAAAPNGAQITITGSNLIGNDSVVGVVRFGVAVVPLANVLAATNTSMVVLAPAGVGNVTVSVTTCGGVANAPQVFTYCNNPPNVTAMENFLGYITPANPYPNTGGFAEIFYIRGTFLVGPNGDLPVVKFGTGSAAILDARADQLAVAVPAATDLGQPFLAGDMVTISVQTCGGTDNTDGGGAFLTFRFN